jgi:ABC-type uncharacterized transport system permease subunit
MSLVEHLKDFATLATILTLFGVGLIIALKSGAVSVGEDRGRLVLGNLSHLIVDLTACVVLILMFQQLAGLRLGLP